MNQRKLQTIRRWLADTLTWVDGGVAELALNKESVEETLRLALSSVGSEDMLTRIQKSLNLNDEKVREQLTMLVTELLEGAAERNGNYVVIGVIA